MPEIDSRRPLKSRSTRWAQVCAQKMLAAGCSPNGVSRASMYAAVAGATAFYFVTRAESGTALCLLWVGAAVCVQLRLLCNLMDGMLAVEGGLKSKTGDLYNEVPDRVADVLFLAGAGYACTRWAPWAVHVGWGAAVMALMTAYLRQLGAALTGSHDFRGPMAKPHRMATLTAGCLAAAVTPAPGQTPWAVIIALAAITAGAAITFLRRLAGVARTLHSRP